MATDSITGRSLKRRDSAGNAEGSTYIAAAETTAPSPVSWLSVSISMYERHARSSSSTVALTGRSRLRRRPSITSTVIVSPGLTPSRSASRRVSDDPSGGTSIGRKAASCGRRSSLSGGQADHRGQVGAMPGAQANRHDALPFDGEDARLARKVADDARDRGDAGR